MKGRVNSVDRVIKEEMDIDRRNIVVGWLLLLFGFSV
jgi:hypothetical protein